MVKEQVMNKERREYFRINDEVVLDYRLVNEADLDTLRETIESPVPDRFTTASSFAASSRQIAHAFHSVQNDSPEVARCLQALDHKLNTLAQLFVAEEIRLDERTAQDVNLSAGGLAFRAQSQINQGALLETRLVLLPSLMGILMVSRVVHCERVNDGDLQFPWQIAVSYEILRESDRELLVRHVMTRETELLRNRRLQNSD